MAVLLGFNILRIGESDAASGKIILGIVIALFTGSVVYLIKHLWEKKEQKATRKKEVNELSRDLVAEVEKACSMYRVNVLKDIENTDSALIAISDSMTGLVGEEIGRVLGSVGPKSREAYVRQLEDLKTFVGKFFSDQNDAVKQTVESLNESFRGMKLATAETAMQPVLNRLELADRAIIHWIAEKEEEIGKIKKDIEYLLKHDVVL